MIKDNQRKGMTDMKVTIVPGKTEHLESVVGILEGSDLGKMYFADKDLRRMLAKVFEKKEIHLALNEKNQCIGFIFTELTGTFGKYPYLHIMAVDENCRGRGVGKTLHRFFEEVLTADYDQLYLMVGDFNPRGKKLYLTLGYKEIGNLPDFYAPGVTETLMVKYKE